jgi:hypothetical protein
MGIVEFIVICLVVGVVLWLINTYVPMEPTVRRVLNVGVVILLILWVVVSVFGITDLGSVRFD